MLTRALLMMTACSWVLPGPSPQASSQDDLDRQIAINEASLLVLHESKLISTELAQAIAGATATILDEQNEPGARRSSNYLVYEARLLELAGSEASRLHTGRSRQDIGSTARRMVLRDAHLDVYDALLAARRVVVNVASRHVDTLIPAYTHGVQAQPTTLAHYLLAFSAALERDAARYRQSYQRINLSPLGAAALGTSGFPVDRERLAALLGFDGLVVNSYDANLVSSVDSKIEFANAMSTSAIPIGQFVQNLHVQYHGTSPWMLLSDDQTGISSIMPQKRNPRPLDRLRLLTSAVVGGAHTVTLNAHNIMSGMNDYRDASQVLETATATRSMYAALANVLTHLVVSAERAMQEIDADYSTMTEVADVLLREADVPFRDGHHYASELTNVGRNANKRPKDLTDSELRRIYREANGQELPVPVSRIRAAMDAAEMIRARRGRGGPQPDEVRRMLDEHQDSLEADTTWLDETQTSLKSANAERTRLIRVLVEKNIAGSGS